MAESSSAIIGVLLDVSGSMRSAFGLDDTRDTTVERAHAIITSIIKIVKAEVGHHKRVDEIFACAFGLSMSTRACDLIALLDIVAGPKDMRNMSGYEALAFLLKKYGAGHAQEWVKEHLDMKEAEDLYKVLCFDHSLIPKLIELLPARGSFGSYAVDGAGYVPLVGGLIQTAAVRNSNAYQKAKELIEDEFSIVERAISKIHHPKPNKVEYVSDLLDDLNLKEDSSHSSRSLQSRIRKLIEQIKPYIYGGTPMCEAIKDAVGVFRRSRADKKVLFILSDGEAEAGDPRQFTQELAYLGVTTVTCYLTDEHIANQKCLLNRIPSSWPNGKAALFEMSSTMQNVVSPVTHLVDAGWKLPSSGECRLFVQANSLDVVDELCEAVVARLTHPCNALVDVLQMVPYNEYINQINDGFKAKKQKKDEGTCYAIAVAAVFRLAMQRIVGREGDYPQFTTIRNRLIREFGKDGADTRSVIAKVAPEYRLHFKEVDEDGARQALNHRRPVVARFTLFDEQWDKFNDFFTSKSKGILTRRDIGDGSSKPGGHAVVLMRCTPQCLVFMNSWGQSWADGGFFRVKDAQTLNGISFFDVYWTEDDLTPKEKARHQKKGTERAKKLAEDFPSINDLLVECHICKQKTKVGEFKGDLIEATCSRCHGTFRPTNEDLAKSLYITSH